MRIVDLKDLRHTHKSPESRAVLVRAHKLYQQCKDRGINRTFADCLRQSHKY